MTPTPPTTDTTPDSAASPEQDPILLALKTHVQQLCENDVRLAVDSEKVWQFATLRIAQLCIPWGGRAVRSLETES